MSNRKRNSRRNLKVAVRNVRQAAIRYARLQEGDEGIAELAEIEDAIRGARDSLDALLDGIEAVDVEQNRRQNSRRSVVLRES